MSESMNVNGPSNPTRAEVDEYIGLRNNPVKYTMALLNRIGTIFALDAAGRPCFRFRNDPDRKLHPIVDDRGRISLRFRSHARALYSYLTKQELLLDDKTLTFIMDECTEEAYKGGREKVDTKAEDQGDYNFEAPVVFAQMLNIDKSGIGHDLLRAIADEPKCPPKFEYSDKNKVMSLELRTSDLWRILVRPEIERQVKSSKSTLYTAINFFSRRLGELEDRFRVVGLDVTVIHRDSGSWTHILRNDANGIADTTVLIATDDQRIPSSSSAAPSVVIRHGDKGLQQTDATVIETEHPKTVN